MMEIRTGVKLSRIIESIIIYYRLYIIYNIYICVSSITSLTQVIIK